MGYTTRSILTQLRTGVRPITKDLRDADARPSFYTPCCPNLTPSQGHTKEILRRRLLAKSLESHDPTKKTVTKTKKNTRLLLIAVGLCLLVETQAMHEEKVNEDGPKPAWTMAMQGKAKKVGCPGHHDLKQFPCPNKKSKCDICRKMVKKGHTIHNCKKCNWDA